MKLSFRNRLHFTEILRKKKGKDVFIHKIPYCDDLPPSTLKRIRNGIAPFIFILLFYYYYLLKFNCLIYSASYYLDYVT